MKKRILIVEDIRIIAMYLRSLLEGFGYDVIAEIKSGEEALEILKRKKPDVIFMDIFLDGELNGIETSKLINEMYDISIIYLTSNSDKATQKQAMDTNPEAFLLKPIDTLKIKNTLEACFEKRELGKL